MIPDAILYRADLRQVKPRAHICIPEARAVDEGAFVRRSRFWAGNDSFVEPREAAVGRQRNNYSRKVSLEEKRSSLTLPSPSFMIQTHLAVSGGRHAK